MKQVIHSKFKPMKREPLFVALSNQKGGVGKSTFTVLLASYFHYLKGYNLSLIHILHHLYGILRTGTPFYADKECTP